MSNKLGTWIKDARTAAGMKQTELAEATGLKQEEISQFERGLRNPNGELDVLCEVLNIPRDEAPRFRRPKIADPAPAPVTGDPTEPRDVYIKIAQLAASIGDTDIAVDALAKID